MELALGCGDLWHRVAQFAFVYGLLVLVGIAASLFGRSDQLRP